MPERLLVTGGCGLIGSALVTRALRAGADVVVLDNLSTGRRENVPAHARVELIVGDVCDDALVGRLVRRCGRVAHLAAGVGVGLILDRPTGALRQSLLGTEIVLRHAAASRRPVFFASTSEVYGDSDGAPVGEERPVGFGSPERLRFSYAAGKAAGEALAFAYAEEYALPVCVGRFFNVTGPCQSSAFGAVLPTFVEQALRGGPITVHGDGTQTRSFLDAADAAEFVWRLRGRRGLVNIGRDEPVTILELAHRVRAHVDPALRIELVSPAADYGAGFVPIHHRRPDVHRLAAWTGYEPRVPLDATIAASLRARRAVRSPP
ncbi:MAG: NAD-dependent epimerase/dehydratase family protein [Planctomycetota bacterium]|jgi:UDP-glucose 4-epimerase